MLDRQTELRIAVCGALVSALFLFVWIPLDIDSRMIETFRRQTYLGDSFLPTILASLMLITSLGQIAVVWRRPKGPAEDRIFDRITFSFFGVVACIIALSLVVMFWAGPLAWTMLGDGELGYRQVRDLAPWKYVGYALGGITMVAGIGGLLEGRISTRMLSAAIGTTVLLILIFDVPFDTILLPPNGDW